MMPVTFSSSSPPSFRISIGGFVTLSLLVATSITTQLSSDYGVTAFAATATSTSLSSTTTAVKPAAAASSDSSAGSFRNPIKDEETGNVYNKILKNVQVPGLKNGMDYIKLGNSDLIVSKVCMGTMTYGIQNTLQEGVNLLNKSFDEYGINFLDTAEIYPVPPNPETQGETDRTVCEFLKGRKREEVILATKVAGRQPMLSYLPRANGKSSGDYGGADLTRQQIIESVDESLKRLGTDYIDLLQLHWPGRYAGGLFGNTDFIPSEYESQYKNENGVPPPREFQEQLSALQELIECGKVRYIGVSNETPYGVCAISTLHEYFPKLYPKCVSIQNSYSLVVRKDYEAGCAEACYHHNVALLPYSPLAGGTLSGKYRKYSTMKQQDIDNDENAKKARLTRFPGYMARYLDSENENAVNAYCDLAESYNLTPTQLALSWCYHNELVGSTIIGATSLEQLEENLLAYDIKLNTQLKTGDSETPTTILDEIGQIYKRYTDPTKAKNDPAPPPAKK